MHADHWEQVAVLLSAALERPTGQRAAYVSAAIEDPALRSEVLSLLSAHDGGGRFDRLVAQLSGLDPAAEALREPDLLERLRTGLAGHYEIEREVGRGGMALVFRAQDLKHGRVVAIKVLRPELGAAIGTERFSREIQIVARLQHANILTLYDSGVVEGSIYYVMPFVDGNSLRTRLEREGQLPLEDALQIAREVAAALAYAHSHDVVHRDIKPENLLLAGDHCLVADFGIARAITAAAGTRLTETGLVIGTPAYMSPEQAAGSQDVDGRSDVYALACVLYEMLSGEPPYTGPTPQAILAKKLSEPLPRISVVRAVPAGVAAVLTKALARTPADRFATAAQFAAALAHSEAVATRSGAIVPTRAGAGVHAPMWRWAKWAAVAVTLALVAIVVSQRLRPKALIVTVSDITPVTNEPGVEFQPAISPDGKFVAYSAGPITAPHIVIRSTAGTATGGEVRVSDTSFTSEMFPSWTGDGESVRFWGCRTDGCAMYETDKLGGAVRPVSMPTRTGIDPSRTAWSPEGERVAYVADDTIYTASAADTSLRRVVVDSNGRFGELNSPAWSPDGKLIAYVLSNPAWRVNSNVETSSIWIVSATGGEPQRVTTADHLNVSPVWLDARSLLFVSDRDGPRGVYSVQVGPQGSRGEPHAVPGVGDPHSISYSSASGILAFSKFTFKQNIWAYPLNGPAPVSIRAGRPVTTGTHVIESHDVSPDGRWIAFNDSRRGEGADLYKASTQGGEAVPLTDLPVFVEAPRWSPDGTEIAFNWYRGTVDTYQIMALAAKGGTPVAITDSLDYNGYPQWSPNGLQIAWKTSRTGRAEVWLVSRDSVGGAWHHPIQITNFGCFLTAWAPGDGGILCASRPDLVAVSPQGRVLWRRDVAAAVGLSHVSYFSFTSHLSRDGRTLYAQATDRKGRRGVWAIPLYGGAARSIVSFDDPALVPRAFLSVGPNNLYLTMSEYESDIWVGKLHW